MPLSTTTKIDREAVLDGGRELLSVHQEAAVAVPRDDDAFRVQRLRRDRRGHAVAHRAGVGRELRAIAAVAVEPVQPRRVVAGAVGEDRVVGQPRIEPRDDLPHVERAGNRSRRTPRDALRFDVANGAGPRRRVDRRFAVHRGKKGTRRRRDGERRLVDAAQLVGVRVNVNELLRGHRRIEQRIARRGDFAQPLADHEQDVGVAHPRRELRIDADADVAGVVAVPVVEKVLIAERAGDGQRVAFGKAPQLRAGVDVPSAAADEHQRAARRPRAAPARPRPARRRAPRRVARRAARRRMPRARSACPREARARPAPAVPTSRRGTRARRTPGSARRGRSAPPTWPRCRTSGGSRSPGTLRDPRSRRRPGRRTRSSASNPAPPCGCRSRRSRRPVRG